MSDPVILSTHAVTLPSTPAEWVQLLPIGVVTGIDGRGPYTVGDRGRLEAIAAASKSYGKGLPLPVDYDHATDLAAPRGLPAPAAGWIRDLEVRSDGLYGKVDWTATAAAQLQEGQYRHISPSFHHAADGTVLRVVRAGLTNNPNFDLAAAIAAAQGAPAPVASGAPMDPFLLTALGLSAGATPEAAVAAAGAGAKARAGMAAVAAALGLGADTDPAAIAAGVAASKTALAAATTGTPDPARYVPIELYTALAAQIRTAGTSEVDRAIAEGKLAPATREWAVAFCAAQPTAFRAFVAAAPVIVAPGAAAPPPATGTATAGLTGDQQSVASALGISRADYLKTLNALRDEA